MTPVSGTHIINTYNRRCIKRINNLYRISYSERLAAINLETLELGRLRIDLIRSAYYTLSILNILTPLTWDC